MGQELVSITIAPRVAIHSYYGQEAWLPLYCQLCCGARAGMDSMCNLCVIIMAVVACVNLGSSKDSLVMHLLQASTKFCFEVQAAHIPGQLNKAADVPF